jgi:uncharacterized protein
MDFRIIDGHLHSGVQHVHWGWDQIRPLLLKARITGAAPIAPVEDIYDRYDPEFSVPPVWQACRRRAHQYLLDLRDPEIDIFPYFFVWNDFASETLGPEYVAIKWHRHPGEPVYHYEDPRCREFLDMVRERQLPVLLEESLENTLFFLEELAPDLKVIIPHLGGLSGGYVALDRAGIWRRHQIYADTALAALPEIKDFIRRFGTDRLIFGSDYPFGNPASELEKIISLDLPEEQTRAILADNFRTLCRLT